LGAYATSAALTEGLAGKADQSALNATDQALAALTVEVDGKQDALTAGTGLVFHERLLEANTVKSLTAGNNARASLCPSARRAEPPARTGQLAPSAW
jgi:hypothetical protein